MGVAVSPAQAQSAAPARSHLAATLADPAVGTACPLVGVHALTEVVVVGIGQNRAVLDRGLEGRAVELARCAVGPLHDDGRGFHGPVVALDAGLSEELPELTVVRPGLAGR